MEGRVHLRVELRREWAQMFHEAWAATVRHAHPACLDGLDAAGVLAAYAPLLPRVSCALELRDLMHEMQAAA